MTADAMARSFLRRAATVLREAERLSGDGAWNLAVRRCQEAVELALKGVLRAAGTEIPKIHDVSGALRRNIDRLPPVDAAILLRVNARRFSPVRVDPVLISRWRSAQGQSRYCSSTSIARPL